jgi:uncharacterized protein DUF397
MTPHAGPTPAPPDLTGVTWRRSSRSAKRKGCVEAAFLADGRVAIRDSKNRSGPALVYTAHEWDAFLTGAKDGEFDLP